MTEYVGLFFILSICSIQSTFLLFCKILVYVVFAEANSTTVLGPITRSLHTNCSLDSTLSCIFYSVFIYFLFIYFFFSIFSSSKLQYSRLYFPFIDEVTEICIKSKFSEKCSNTDRGVGAKLYRLNLTAVNHSIL